MSAFWTSNQHNTFAILLDLSKINFVFFYVEYGYTRLKMYREWAKGGI